MIDVKAAAAYIFCRYLNEKKTRISEMMLHKLLYFSQREAIVLTGEPMFPELFEAWKYGPVIVCVREMYKNNAFFDVSLSSTASKEYSSVFDSVFEKYADMDAWELSDLTHSEISWKNARKMALKTGNIDNLIAVEDIRKDANNISMRRFFVEQILPQHS